MKRCTRLGINITKRCNWRCKTCFYRHETGYFKPEDVPLSELVVKIQQAKQRGLVHVVVVGFGEPWLYPQLPELISECNNIGISSSIITNGTATPDFYEDLYVRGLDHLHISVHGIGEVLNEISESPVAGEKQLQVLKWLKETGLPWRSNTTIQQSNYQKLPEIAEHCLDHGSKHVVLLGFLPHYGWCKKMNEVAVHPELLRPYIEKAIDKTIDAGQWVTLRYHPMCHLSEKYWPYVTNANMVLFDTGEWEYGNSATLDDESLKRAAWQLGQDVAIKKEPCTKCALYQHCGGWNATYAGGFDGAGLTSISKDTLPKEYNQFGYYWYQNSFNNEFKGYFK